MCFIAIINFKNHGDFPVFISSYEFDKTITTDAIKKAREKTRLSKPDQEKLLVENITFKDCIDYKEKYGKNWKYWYLIPIIEIIAPRMNDYEIGEYFYDPSALDVYQSRLIAKIKNKEECASQNRRVKADIS